jgi:hypothetical protein
MNTIQINAVTKFEVVLAKLGSNGLTQPMLAGFAVQFEGESHYVIRLTMFPNNPYYLSKNKGSQDGYTVFAKVLKDPETSAIRFQNPVGSGRLLEETKSHLEIRFPLIGTSVFMNLYPVS